MPLVNAYCTLESVQKETGNSDTDLLAWFEECINIASRWIDDHCNTDFLPHDHSASAYTVSDADIIGPNIFAPWRILTLTEVTTADGAVDSGLYSFEVGRRGIMLRNGSNWLAGSSTPVNRSGYSVAFQGFSGGYSTPFTLKGTFGYETPPAAINRACTKIASAWSHEKRRERVSQDGARTSVLDERIPDDAVLLLKRFRRLVY